MVRKLSTSHTFFGFFSLLVTDHSMYSEYYPVPYNPELILQFVYVTRISMHSKSQLSLLEEYGFFFRVSKEFVFVKMVLTEYHFELTSLEISLQNKTFCPNHSRVLQYKFVSHLPLLLALHLYLVY